MVLDRACGSHPGIAVRLAIDVPGEVEGMDASLVSTPATFGGGGLISPSRAGSPSSPNRPSPKASNCSWEDEPDLKEAAPPTIAIKTDKLVCGAESVALLMGLAAFFLLEAILLPWWTWKGRVVDDYWGMSPGVEDRFSPLTACNAGGRSPPDSSVCLTTASLSTLLVVSCALAAAGSGLSAAVAFRYRWLYLLLLTALIAAGSAVLGGLSLWMAAGLQSQGLTGEGFYLGLTGVGFALAAACLAIWSANKATPPPGALVEEAPEQKESRIVRTRIAREAAVMLIQAMEEKERQCRGRRAGAASAAPRGATKKDKVILESDGQPVVADGASTGRRIMLQHVIDYTSGEHGQRRIPETLLEAAFMEIDSNFSGKITTHELAEALRDCGLNVDEESMDRIMRDMDTDSSGKLDIEEFAEFFNMTMELVEWEEKQEQQKSFYAGCLQVGFFVNIVAVASIITVQSRSASSGSEQYRRVQQVSQILMASFLMLFFSVIVRPLLRMTLGPSLVAWMDVILFYIHRAIRRWRARRAAAAAEAQKLQELARKAEEFEAKELNKLDVNSEGSPDPSPRTTQVRGSTFGDASPAGSGLRQLGWAGAGSRTSMASPGTGSQPPRMSMASPLSRRSGFGSRTTVCTADKDKEEDDGTDKPGIYLVLHGDTAIRTGISTTSAKIGVLHRGQKVKIVEVFEYPRQHRVRGRLQSALGKHERHWISIRDTTDDYCWAKRIGPLQEESEWQRKARERKSLGGGSVRPSRRSKQSQVTSMAVKVASAQTIDEDDPNQTPAYAPDMYDDAERRLWTETYLDGYVKLFCMRSKWSTKERLVLDFFAERVLDAQFIHPDDMTEDTPPGSRLRDFKIEFPPGVMIQIVESSQKMPQRELKDGLVLLNRDELVDVSPTVTVLLWQHPEAEDMERLTPFSRSLAGCCARYELLLPGKQDLDIYVQAALRWDTWFQQRSFNLMQAHDTKLHQSRADTLPDDKEVQGGLATNRGEWRLGLCDK